MNTNPNWRESLAKSHAIQQENKRKRIAEYEANPKLCKQCGGAIPYHVKSVNSFCSSSCAASYNNAKRPPRDSVLVTRTEIENGKAVKRKVKAKRYDMVCRCCGKVKRVTESALKRLKFCSLKCQRDLDFNERYERFLQEDPTAFKSNRNARRALIRRDGDKCSVCGITNWNNKPIVFEVEHKDGNSENHVASNLCLICPNCHSQTPTYKGANKGNGRHARRQRYADGKSY